MALILKSQETESVSKRLRTDQLFEKRHRSEMMKHVRSQLGLQCIT